MLFIILFGSIITSCVEEKIYIPFGYDPNFDYLKILKGSPPYAYESTYEYPEFKYQNAEHDSLTKLRILYKLDSIAGEGAEFDRIMNLFKWVHNEIRHNGSNSTPDPENSLCILDYCYKSGAGVNCVYMAIVFNEACLSLGIKSRVIQVLKD